MHLAAVIFTFIAAVGSGLIAGLFFAFSNFVMKALGSVAPERGMASMQAINRTVLNPLFLGVFLGTAFVCAAAVIYAVWRWEAPGAAWLFFGAVLYLAGTLLVTMIFNLPLNDLLASVDPLSAEGVRVWQDYVVRWTVWNHVRTAASLAATASFILAFCRLRESLV